MTVLYAQFVPPQPVLDYSLAAFPDAMRLHRERGWVDFLVPREEAIKAIYALVEANIGEFLILRSIDQYRRWIWLSPEAIGYLRSLGWAPEYNANEATAINGIDARSEYEDILTRLGRDKYGKKRNDAENLAA